MADICAFNTIYLTYYIRGNIRDVNMQFEIWTLAAIFLAAAVAFWGFRLLRNRLEEQRYQEELAELEFEQTLFSGDSGNFDAQNLAFLQTAPSTAVVDQTNVTPPPSFPVPPSMETVSLITSREPQPADITAATVIRRLKLSGLMGSVEGYIPLHGNPKGVAILSLRNGKRALLVPQMESEMFFRRHAPQADYIIVMGTDGGSLVVTPFEQLLAENAAR